MGRPKKITNENEEIINNNEETIVQPESDDLHLKYAKYIKQSESNFIRDIEYGEMMEMVQYIQKKTNRNYPFNATCGSCVLSMVQLFSRLK